MVQNATEPQTFSNRRSSNTTVSFTEVAQQNTPSACCCSATPPLPRHCATVAPTVKPLAVAGKCVPQVLDGLNYLPSVGGRHARRKHNKTVFSVYYGLASFCFVSGQTLGVNEAASLLKTHSVELELTEESVVVRSRLL